MLLIIAFGVILTSKNFQQFDLQLINTKNQLYKSTLKSAPIACR